jgi:hypothetical protein
MPLEEVVNNNGDNIMELPKIPEHLTDKAGKFITLTNIGLAIDLIYRVIGLVLYIALIGAAIWYGATVIPWETFK